MDREAGGLLSIGSVAQSWTKLKQLSMHACSDKCIYTYNHYVVLINCSFYHYMMLLSHVTVFDLKSVLTDIYMATLYHFVSHLHDISLSICFNFSITWVLESKDSLL